MGVPKLFRFLSERYPCLSEVVKEYEIHEYDNFYIDANGIIHNCSHPSDDIHFRISEEQIFKDIFYYLEVLFRLIKPKKLFFIAIDGVAPRAKMNQQRSRRFRSAKDVEKAVNEAIKKGEELPNAERFDSNCITPGTVFMEKLHRQLQYFIKDKVTNDELWQRPKIILSGHNVPGEGEHKIMDYIRYMRSQPGWDPNTRHCLHGLDADLIMLGLCSHEPHFSLLREEVKFTKSHAKKKTNVEETKFYLLHLSLMRDYLDLEFQELKKTLPFEYDIERIIDDWVLMGFLVGNDFIPHLPHFHIANNALSLLYKAYSEILPTLDGYINNCGTLNLERFEKYLKKLAEVDFENFKDIQGDLKYFESKTGNKFPGTSKASELDKELDDEVLALAKETDLMLSLGNEDETEDSSDEEQLKEEFRVHKEDFYRYKLEYEKVDGDTLKEQTECYIRAIQWNLNYYYTGCPSWSWFYPHHYAPYVSDIKGFSGLDFTFESSKPFLPFQQLLAVLPAGSKQLVPKPFQDLMTSVDSPIIKFYPSEFLTDLNGKKHDWEAIVLIPFIEENELLSAMEPYYKDLTVEENMRNSIQPMEIYEYTSEDLGYWAAPNYFPPIRNNHAKVTFVSTFDVSLRQNEVVKGRLEGAIAGAYLGFPHLGGIEFTAKLSPCKVKVFEHPSRGDNMILKIPYKKMSDEEIKIIANELLGEIVFVGWPHIQRGKVTAILTQKFQFRMDSGKFLMNEEKSMEFGLDSVDQCRSHKQTLGIDLQKIDIVVYVKTVEDRRYVYENNKAKLLYLWSKKSTPFPYQTLLRSAPLINTDYDIGVEKDLTEVFSEGQRVFILSRDNYGSFGKVCNVLSNETVEVEIEIKPSLDLSDVLNLSMATDLKYFTGNIAAQRLGIGSHLFSRVTGSIFIQNIENDETLNAGLSLKFTKHEEEVAEFTKKVGNMWLYSEKTIALVDDYMKKFPELFEYLERNTGNDMFFNKDVFPENPKEKLHAIKQWIKAQPHNTAERRPFGSKLLTNEAMREIEKRILLGGLDQVLSTKIVKVHPSKLHIPSENISKAPPDPSVTMKLLDRITFVRKSHFIPLGLNGTIVGYETPNPTEQTLFDILLDSPVRGGSCQACDEARIYRLTYQAFINISHSRRDSDQLIDYSAPVENNFTNKREDWRRNNSKSSNRKSYKFQPSPSGDKNPNMQNIGNTKVKEFFDTYLNAGKASSLPADKIQTMVVSNSKSSDNVPATSEFHAMWNVLQGHSLNEEKPLRPQVPLAESLVPTENSAAEQTNALRKLLKLSSMPADGNQHSPVDLRPQVPPSQQPNIVSMKMPPANADVYSLPVNHGNLTMQVPRSTKSCGHVSCCSDLVRLCANKNIAYPLFNYNKTPKVGDTTCSVVFFVDFGTVVGDPCKTKEEAAESAACKAIRHILQKDDMPRPLLPTGIGYIYPTSGVRPAGNLRIGMGPLPPPPMQWWQSRPMITVSDQQHQQQLLNSKRHIPKGVTPPAMLQQRNLAGTSSTERSNCKDNISNVPFKEENTEGGSTKSESQIQGSGSSKNSAGHRSGSKKSFRGKSRPRIAANFSVPIADQ